MVQSVVYLVMLLHTFPNYTHNCLFVQVRLQRTGMGPEALRYLAPSLPRIEGLRILALQHNDLGNTGARHLCAVLPVSSALQLLDLSSNNLDCSVARMLAAALGRTPCLHGICLADNPLLDDGVRLLAEKLLGFSNTVLQVPPPMPMHCWNQRWAIALNLWVTAMKNRYSNSKWFYLRQCDSPFLAGAH